jgi:hypothetical protein
VTPQLLERLDLLTDRLLRDVQFLGGASEAATLGDGGEVPHLAQVGRDHTAECTTVSRARRQAEVVAEQQRALVRPAAWHLPSLGEPLNCSRVAPQP